MFKMKNYNTYPAKDYLVISPRSQVCLDNDKSLCLRNSLTSLDFCIWYDESLLTCEKLDFSKEAFDFILYLFDYGYIKAEKYLQSPNKSFRISCLLFSKFVHCDVKRIKSFTKQFLSENPDFLKTREQKLKDEYDFTTTFIYDRYKSNKLIFPYFAKNKVNKSLVAELISRQFISFDDKYNNVVYINKDMTDNISIEKHGIGTKHFMRLEGKAFPFIYFSESDNYDYKRFLRCEAFATTLELLQYLSENEICEDVVYISMHTDNYNPDALKNFKIVFGELHINYHFENTVDEKQIQDEIDEEYPF